VQPAHHALQEPPLCLHCFSLLHHKTMSAPAAATAKAGAFVRKEAVFRRAVSSAADAEFPAEAGRYLLYVSYACPWASRCLALRRIKGLEAAVGVVSVTPLWVETRPAADKHRGWYFDAAYDEFTDADPVFGVKTVREVYDLATPEGATPTGIYSVPFLLDTKTKTIVNNESSDIIRMFNSEFNAVAANPTVELRPAAHLAAIDAVNASFYEAINNGVYKCGFASTQAAYDAAVAPLFQRLEELNDLLGTQRWLVGGHPTPTESDIRLFVTLVRFDDVYLVHFKCNKRAIREYANLREWMSDLYTTCDLAPTVNMKHIVEHYYLCHRSINVHGIVPVGPGGLANITVAHDRATRAF
jgi:putative glutathione S-transferase